MARYEINLILSMSSEDILSGKSARVAILFSHFGVEERQLLWRLWESLANGIGACAGLAYGRRWRGSASD